MILFTIYGLFTKMLYDGNGRKNPEIYKRRNKGKNSPFGCPHPVYEVEADCFPVSKNTENKPDLP